jgi:hypothetical protein
VPLQIRTYLQLTEDQEPKLVPYSNTFNISPDDFDSSAGLLAAAGHAPGGSQLSQVRPVVCARQHVGGSSPAGGTEQHYSF